MNGSKLLFQIKNNLAPNCPNLVACLLPEDIQGDPLEFDAQNFLDQIEVKAIICIQSFGRMIIAKRRVRKMKILLKKIKFIQSWFRVFLQQKMLKLQILERNREIFEDFEILQEELAKNWGVIKKAGRVEIHYNNLDGDELRKLSMTKYDQKQNIQASRIFRIAEPGVEVIYISTKEIPKDIIKYYYKILELGGVQSPQRRVHFLDVTENSEIFPDHFSTPSKILYSKRTLSLINKIVAGRFSMLVSGNPCNDDIKLSVQLKAPILSGHPLKSQIFSTVSQSKILFKECGLPVAPYSSKIYKRDDVVVHLSKLILEMVHIERWVFKIDNESSGRGNAYFDVSSVQQLKNMRKKNKLLPEAEIFAKIQALLLRFLPKKLVIAKSKLYYDYEEYIEEFCSQGKFLFIKRRSDRSQSFGCSKKYRKPSYSYAN